MQVLTLAKLYFTSKNVRCVRVVEAPVPSDRWTNPNGNLTIKERESYAEAVVN
jgi:hypothetical protein